MRNSKRKKNEEEGWVKKYSGLEWELEPQGGVRLANDPWVSVQCLEILVSHFTNFCLLL